MNIKKILIVVALIILIIVVRNNIDFFKQGNPILEENLRDNDPNDIVEDNSIETTNFLEEEFIEVFTYEEIPEDIVKKIYDVSYKENEYISIDDLSYVKVMYWGFDGNAHQGELIVHSSLAKEVTEIFMELYEGKFPMERIRLVDEYNADDDLSMADNNTSSFNFRVVAGSQTISNHSYGVAIDINPIQNPYVKGDIILPSEGEDYLDRSNVRDGMIIKDDVVYNAFIKRGWTWGGDWNSLKDYQHFEKKISLD